MNEEQAINKVSRILSKLEPEAAARAARSVVERFATGAAAADGDAPTRGDPPPPPRPAAEAADSRPSFLQTQFRIAVGKELLDEERSGCRSGAGRRRR